MEPRFDYIKASPEAFQAMWALEQFVSEKSGLEARLLHLLKIRASHINGCAFCIDMHRKEALKTGLTEQWISLIAAWRESTLYTDKERAVLAWTDALTTVAQTGAPDEDFEALKTYFSEDEMTKLSLAIGAINIWNRLSLGFRTEHPIDAS